MEKEKFCLRWNDFENNLSSAFRYLRDGQDFFNVTLVCEDEQIQAHKVILSACSPFFHKVLKRNPHQHPLLFMKGVRCSDMQSVLDFMYHGEVSVAQEELNSFLAVAEDLSVKGLTQNQPQEKQIPKNTKYVPTRQITAKVQPSSPFVKPQPNLHNHPPRNLPAEHEDGEEVQVVLPIKTEPESQAASHPAEDSYDYSTMAVYQEGGQEGFNEPEANMAGHIIEGQTLSSGIGQNQEDEQDEFETYWRQNSGQLEKKTWSCYLCGKITNQSCHMRQHFEAFHYSLGEIRCETCEKIFKTRHSLATHVSKHHRNKANMF